MEVAVKPGKEEMLFATPLYIFELEGHESLNALLVQECCAIRNQSSGITRSNQNGWHSKTDLFARTEPGISKLCTTINSCLSKVIEHSTKDRARSIILTCNGWININPKWAFNKPHNHPGFLWSGTYYVKVPKVSTGQSGHIEFLDPRTNANAIAGSSFQPRYSIAPHPGMLIIFPAYLVHWVYPNEQDEERITIAFNCRMTQGAAEV